MTEARKNPDVIALIVIVLALACGWCRTPVPGADSISVQPLVFFPDFDTPDSGVDLGLPFRLR